MNYLWAPEPSNAVKTKASVGALLNSLDHNHHTDNIDNDDNDPLLNAHDKNSTAMALVAPSTTLTTSECATFPLPTPTTPS